MANAPRLSGPRTRSLFDILLARAEARPPPPAPTDPVAAGRAAFASMLIGDCVSVEATFELLHRPGRRPAKRARKKENAGIAFTEKVGEDRSELPVVKRPKVAVELEDGGDDECEVTFLEDFNDLNSPPPILLPPLSDESVQCELSDDSVPGESPSSQPSKAPRIWACTAGIRQAPDGPPWKGAWE